MDPTHIKPVEKDSNSASTENTSNISAPLDRTRAPRGSDQSGVEATVEGSGAGESSKESGDENNEESGNNGPKETNHEGTEENSGASSRESTAESPKRCACINTSAGRRENTGVPLVNSSITAHRSIIVHGSLEVKLKVNEPLDQASSP